MDVAPQPASLAAARASLPTIRGLVGVAIAQDKASLTLTLSHPSGVPARVCLPLPAAAASELPSDFGLELDGRPAAFSVEGLVLCLKAPLVGDGKEHVVAVRSASKTD